MLSIHMHDDGRVRMIREETDQPQKVKHVALQDLIEAFQDQTMSSPLLPPGTVQYWRGSSNETLAVFTPAHKRTMLLCGREYKDMPVPPTLFVFQLYRYEDSLSIGNSAVFVLKDDFRGEGTWLHKFPYGNVFDDNRICWGEVNPGLKSVYQVGSLVDMFLGSDFNLDLSGMYRQDRWNDTEHGVDLYGFWDKMSKLDQVPDELLIDVGTYRDVEDILYFIRN